MIKAIIFDFGGVLLRTRDYTGRRKWEARLGLEQWGVDRLVFECEASRRGQAGELPEEAMWESVARQTGLDAQAMAEFRRDFWAGDYVDQEMIALIRQLRAHYKVGLLSNAWNTLRSMLQRETLGIPITLFDAVVVSAEEGMLKPDARIYRRAAERLGVAPEEAVFVDDVRANVEGARAVGMAGVHFTGAPETAAGLRALGVDV